MNRITLDAERTVAFESPDHLHPTGTKLDNSRNARFNSKLYALLGKSRTLCVLDMGCSGGGYVKDCLDAGCIAVGLEGSDYSKKLKRAEWRTIPENLFTCDITAPFSLFTSGASDERETMLFDAVTCWEVMEHIAREDLPQLIDNVKRHLAPNGIWIMSVSPNESNVDGVNLHQTMEGKAWWVAQFAERGLIHDERYIRYFNTQYVRGPKFGAPGSFHLVLRRDNEAGPTPPNESLLKRLDDRYQNCLLQRLMRHVLVGSG